MFMESITSEYLSASAGSGKTYALSQRFCRLVMSGVPPEEICALTFTRPATREIFSAVIKRLLTDDSLDGKLPYTREQALARVLRVLPQLQISTIDAFSAKIARLFAYEVGLDPDFTLYDGGNSPEGQAFLHEMLRRAFAKSDKGSTRELLNIFDIQDAHTAESAPLSQQWKQFWMAYSSAIQAHPDGWGDLERIGEPYAKRCERPEDLVGRALAMLDALEGEKGANTRGIKRLRTLLAEYHAEVVSLRRLHTLWGGPWKSAETFNACATDGAFTYYNKPVILDEPLREIYDALWQDLIARDVEQTVQHTQALYRALTALKAAERQLAEETGMVSFDGVTRTLSEAIGGNLSVRNPNAFYVTYRLDTAIRHLMIDEFQDTSTAQWKVLSGVAHELAAEEDGTFFYVGDTKQSIYAWRGGDPTLFADQSRLPAIPAGTPLVESYRSGPAIIKFVNTVMKFNLDVRFDEKIAWQYDNLKRWNEQWQDHVAHSDVPNYVQMVALGGKREEWIISAARMIAARWRQVAGQHRTIAVMAPSNPILQGEKGLLRYLRQEGVPCAVDGKRNIVDTPIGTLVLHLLHWMADPRSTLSYGIAQQIGVVEATPQETLAEWMHCVNRHGFAAWIDLVFGEKSPARKRLSGLDLNVLDAVRHGLEKVDQQGSVDPTKAKRMLELLQVQCSAEDEVVNLMTIHHSKGLTYDVVFTVLAGKINDERYVTHEAGLDWVLEKPILNETYQRLPAMKEARESRLHDKMYDTLCMLYVAITRARYEQIVLAPESAAKTLSSVAGWLYQKFDVDAAPSCKGIADTEVTFPTFEKAVVPAVDCYHDGDPTWWQSHKGEDNNTEETLIQLAQWEREAPTDVAEVGLPSESAKAKTITELLAQHGSAARHFGVSVHEQLSAVEWSDSPPGKLFPAVFRKPNEPCELWRERPFSVNVSDDGSLRYCAGQFDRAHLFPERREAVIYDFKTARLAEVTEAYRKQMTDYRKALAVLTGYDEAKIRTILLFTRHHQAIEVTHD